MEAVLRFSLHFQPTSMGAVYRGGESFPDPQVPCVFLQHALGMKLQSHHKIGVRDRSRPRSIRHRHAPSAGSEAPDREFPDDDNYSPADFSGDTSAREEFRD